MSGRRRSLGAPLEHRALNGYLQALDDWSASVRTKSKPTRTSTRRASNTRNEVKNVITCIEPKKKTMVTKNDPRPRCRTKTQNLPKTTSMKERNCKKPQTRNAKAKANDKVNHEKILTKEFLKKKRTAPPIDLTAAPVRLRAYKGSAPTPAEPQVITMRPKICSEPSSGATSCTASPDSKSSKKTKKIKSRAPKTSKFLQELISNCSNVDKQKQPIAVPFSLLTNEKYVLPVTEDRNKAKKIEDMAILREMLKMNKIKLSNGVQITIPSVKPTYECNDCGRCFRYKHDLRKHIYIHLDIKPYQCPHCDRGFRQQGNLKTHITRLHANCLAAPEVYICHHCHKQFFVKEAIRAHVLTHETLKPYQCKQCGKKFVRDTRLRAHMRGHAGSCRFDCSLCNASYTNRSRLNVHIKTHLGIRDLICHVCGKSFGRADCIQQHLSCLHDNVKRFQCPICFKKLKGHLREHMRTHMQAKPYACIECGRRFAQSSQLNVHKRSHNGVKPYVCRVCKRPFSHSNALLLHVRVHTGERPFECAMCPQTFSQLPHMKAHMLSIHNKEESYKCGDCGKFFKLKVNLEAHRVECAARAAAALSWEERLMQTPADNPEDSSMTISRMRFLLAILLRTIADDARLKVLGFNKRLIDELLVDSLEATGHEPCTDPAVSPAQRLRINIQLLLEWTVPRDIMRRFRAQNKTTEQLLEELTS